MLKRVQDWQRLDAGGRRAALDRSVYAARSADGVFISIEAPVGRLTDGALSGVPIAVKDNVDAFGFLTTAGTPALHDARPEGEAPAVTALR